jgi:DNA (cytosine-5)-methyltransferase 1
MPLLLSIFPGIDLLGRAFDEAGFCVVRGPDLLWGGDVRIFHVPAKRFDGVIGGPPCPDFSSAQRGGPTGYGAQMLAEFLRVVEESECRWWLLENVPGVPDVSAGGYIVQRFDLRGTEVGLRQRRLRHFQFGSREGRPLVIDRADAKGDFEPAAVASEGKRSKKREWLKFCQLMGLPSALELPGMKVHARYEAVGNGVPLPMGRIIAVAIRRWMIGRADHRRVCVCGCGRVCDTPRLHALVSCRKRTERRRKRVTGQESSAAAVSPCLAGGRVTCQGHAQPAESPGQEPSPSMVVGAAP